MGIRKHRVWQELPTVTPNADTKMIVTDNDGKYLGYASVADLQVTVDGDGLAKDTDLTDGSIDAVFNTVRADSNGSGSNFEVGDDAFIGDINVVNTIQIKGAQDATKGYIQFGSGSSMPKIGGSGVNHLNITNIPAYANNAAAIAGGLVVGDIYRLSDYIGIVH